MLDEISRHNSNQYVLLYGTRQDANIQRWDVKLVLVYRVCDVNHVRSFTTAFAYVCMYDLGDPASSKHRRQTLLWLSCTSAVIMGHSTATHGQKPTTRLTVRTSMFGQRTTRCCSEEVSTFLAFQARSRCSLPQSSRATLLQGVLKHTPLPSSLSLLPPPLETTENRPFSGRPAAAQLQRSGDSRTVR